MTRDLYNLNLLANLMVLLRLILFNLAVQLLPMEYITVKRHTPKKDEKAVNIRCFEKGIFAGNFNNLVCILIILVAALVEFFSPFRIGRLF